MRLQEKEKTKFSEIYIFQVCDRKILLLNVTHGAHVQIYICL